MDNLIPRPSIIPPIWTNEYLRPLLDGIQGLLRTAVDGIKSIALYVKTVVADTAELVKVVDDIDIQIRDLFDWMPGAVVGALTVGMAVVVLYKVVGRT